MEAQKLSAALGLSGVGMFGGLLVLFSFLNPNFHPLDDYVSQLGALGQPHATWWNVFGFGLVGVLLSAFGWIYGRVIQDRLVGFLLAFFGAGFAVTSVPMNLADEVATVSTVHIVAICLGLAGWMLGLARMAYVQSLDRAVRRAANVAATLLYVPILGQVAGLWSMPVTHRLVFAVVFGWILFTSIHLMRDASPRRA